MDVLLIVDQKWRDLPAMAALRVVLEELYGRSAALVPFTAWRYSLMRLRPQAVVLTHMNGPRSRAIAELAAEIGTRVVVMPTEGRPGNAEAMDYAFGSGADFRAVDLLFTWSEETRQYVLERGTLPADRVITAGVPRFDVYREPFTRLAMTRPEFASKYGLDAARPIVTWATNFTHAKFHRQCEEFLVRDWKALGLLRYSLYSDPLEFARLDFEARRASLAAVRELLRVLPDLQLALKPHPHEEHGAYTRFVEECRREFGPRVALITFAYISDLLHASDLHIHRMCMTGIESWLLGLPSIELHLLDYQSMSLDVPGATRDAVGGSDLVRSPEALVDTVRRYLGGARPAPEQVDLRDRYIRRWLFQVDGRRSFAHARALSDLVAERRPTRRPRPSLAAARALAGALARRAAGLQWYEPLSRRADWTDSIGQVDNIIRPADVERWTARAAAALRASRPGELAERRAYA